MIGTSSPPGPSLLPHGRLGVLSALFGAGLWLSACASITGGPSTTTLGTRETVSQPNPPLIGKASALWTDYSRPAEYPNAVTLPLQFIPTSSGQNLAVLVSVPAGSGGDPVPGRFPAILTQTAYRIDVSNLLGVVVPADTTLVIGGMDKYMIERGYVTVAVDALGTGMSSGVTRLLGREEQAAYGDAVDWVTQQPWFDGNLGLAGTSYLGISALFTAEQGDPAVKAVFAEVPMGDPYRGPAAPGGMLNGNFVSRWLTITQNLSVSNDLAEIANPAYASQIAAANAEHVQAIDDWYLPTIDDSLAGVPGYATDDGDFWAVRSPLEHARDITVPTFIIGGSDDLFRRSEPLLYEQLKRNVNTKLLIVSGAHVQAVLDAMISHDDDVSTGAPGSEQLMLRWFDQYLKDIDTGADSLPEVTQYVEGYGRNGAERYTTTTDWPDPRISPTRYFLHSDMSLGPLQPTLKELPRQVDEPSAPVVSISSSIDGTRMLGSVTVHDGSDCSSSDVQWSLGLDGLVPRPCYSNDNKVEDSQHALVYDTAPVESDLYVNGPIEADIWMSATRSQAALAIRVDDVDLDGNATPLSTGLQSAAFRAVDPSRSRYIDGVMIQPWHPFTVASERPLARGRPVEVRVEILPTAAVLRPGHRLRIAISASNQVEGIWPTPKQAEATGNVTTIYTDPLHPSSVVLPVVPTSALN